MIWDLLLGAALEAGLGLIAEVGFGDEARALRDRLRQTPERQRQEAFANAVQKAADAVKEPGLDALLRHAPFQEQVISALLDPEQGLDLDAVAAAWQEKLPVHRLALRRFFNSLENALVADSVWGPLLERYYELRFHKEEVGRGLAERRLDIPTPQLVRQLNAQLIGSGAIAQDQGVAASGSRAIAVGGNVQQIVQVFVEKIIIDSGGGAGNAVSLRRRYLQEMADDANLLPWQAINVHSADPHKSVDLRLADVYTNLDTTTLRHMEREEELRAFMARMHEAERVPAEEMASQQASLLLLGDPGSGKSTFTKHLAYTLAQAGLADDPQPWLEALQGWAAGPLLPVRLELRQAAAFATEQGLTQGDLRLFKKYLHAWLGEIDLTGLAEELIESMQSDQPALLFLLDGLDEVPTGQRQMLVDMVNAVRRRYPRQRYLVTCRPYAYVGQPWQLRGFHEATLAPFSDQQIELFIGNWYRQLSRLGRFNSKEAEQKASDLQAVVGRADLRGMAERPLLLTVMTQLHAFAGELPEDRTSLYADAVDLLLKRWEARGGQKGLIERLGIPHLKMSNLEAGLHEVAYHAHSSQSEGETADIGEGELRQWLQPYLGGDWNKAGEFVDYIRERAGLLIRHKTEAYTFPHRTFQEFLAACHLVNSPDYPSLAAELVGKDASRWREVYLLAAGYAARQHRPGQAIAAVNALCPQDIERCSTLNAEMWRRAILAGEALLEIGLVGVQIEPTGRALLERLQGWLVRALRQDEALTAVERAAAGRVLAKLGDPRPEVLDPMQIEWIEIPAGPFLMGEGKEQHTVILPAYRISRFPITNAQFVVFVQAGGYGAERYWPEAKAAGVWKDGQIYSQGEDEPTAGPWPAGEPYDLSNHPGVGVCWYEALAYTRWLSEQWQAEGRLQDGWAVRLPSEAEREKAARGADGREYPWGAEPDPNRANYYATGIGAGSAVGCFPSGASPYGVEEMSGNVWEWCLSKHMEYPYADDKRNLADASGDTRVLRGGSFNGVPRLVRCAVRYHGSPYYRYRFVGFRVVLSPAQAGQTP